MRLTIKTTLIGIVSLLVLLLAGLAWMAVSGTSAINLNAEDVATNWLPSVRALGDVKFLAAQTRVRGARLLMTVDAAERRKIEAQVAQNADELRSTMKIYERLVTAPEE